MVQSTEVVSDDDEITISRRLVSVDDDDWKAFQRMWGKGRVSARIRELVREDLERG